MWTIQQLAATGLVQRHEASERTQLVAAACEKSGTPQNAGTIPGETS